MAVPLRAWQTWSWHAGVPRLTPDEVGSRQGPPIECRIARRPRSALSGRGRLVSIGSLWSGVECPGGHLFVVPRRRAPSARLVVLPSGRIGRRGASEVDFPRCCHYSGRGQPKRPLWWPLTGTSRDGRRRSDEPAPCPIAILTRAVHGCSALGDTRVRLISCPGVHPADTIGGARVSFQRRRTPNSPPFGCPATTVPLAFDFGVLRVDILAR